MSDPAVVVLRQVALPLAEKIAGAIGARVDLRGRDFDKTLTHIGDLFLAGQPVIAVAASGIVIRALAPFLSDKWSEPPIVSVSESGSAVVPLLGGHRGANRLAARIADLLDSTAAITTAGDSVLGVALDEPPGDWHLENPEDAGLATAALLDGARARLSGSAEWLAPLKGRVIFDPAPDADAPLVLRVEGAEPLIYRRQSFVLGVGCARGCSPDEMIGHVMRTLADAGRAAGEIAEVISIDLKSDEAAVHALARYLNVPAAFFPAERLEEEKPRLLSPSETVFREVGCHGVAEGAALAAAGSDATLVIPKTKSANATCALARRGGNASMGLSRGQLSIVGVGPGQSAWRTPEVSRLLGMADELVGYGLYIDLLGQAARGKIRRDFALGEEEDRCRYALERAGEGRRVALVCSGDGGIFAMGALVMELLDRPIDAGGVSDAARRSEIIHAPGISALQAASARAGALLGHDFCAISLSDLLTPRETIVRRFKAAAEADFVIAFYNPVSRRRRTLLTEARDILLAHRPADTPVLLASNLGRPDERLVVRDLADLQVDEVDMLTVVLVGSSASRRVSSGDMSAGAGGTWIYTPRGYARKIDGDLA